MGQEADLKVWAGDASGDLFKEWFLDFGELSGFDHVQNLLNLPQKHNFFLGTSLWPVLQKTQNHGFGERGIFFQELDDAVCELWMIQTQTFGLMQRDKNFDQELFVFLFQGQSKAIDYAVAGKCTSDTGHRQGDTYLPSISSSSPTPLKCSVSYMNRKKMLLICFLIKARSPRNLP